MRVDIFSEFFNSRTNFDKFYFEKGRKEEKKRERKKGRKKGKKEERKKKGRKEGRKERKERKCVRERERERERERASEKTSRSYFVRLCYFISTPLLKNPRFSFKEILKMILENFEINLWKNLETFKKFFVNLRNL